MQLTAKLRSPPTCDDLVRDAESEYLELMQDQEDAKGAILSARTDTSVRAYRLVSGPNAGLGAPTKPLTLPTVLVRTEQPKGDDLVSQQSEGGPQVFAARWNRL